MLKYVNLLTIKQGGLFANVKLNQKINELDWVDEIYIMPPMGDEGLALGACINDCVKISASLNSDFSFSHKAKKI